MNRCGSTVCACVDCLQRLYVSGLDEGVDIGCSGDNKGTMVSHINEAATNDKNEKQSKSQVRNLFALAAMALSCFIRCVCAWMRVCVRACMYVAYNLVVFYNVQITSLSYSPVGLSEL